MGHKEAYPLFFSIQVYERDLIKWAQHFGYPIFLLLPVGFEIVESEFWSEDLATVD